MGGEFEEMCNSLIALMINYGIIAAIIDRYPQDVQEAFAERVRGLTDKARSETAEVQSFGEAYDADPQ